ncbi:acyltransferase [Enterobacter asburiae]|uniref:acyltransferase n=1 Tax=Enterobacter asburiae TaxID=61645 RepID=UPI00200373D7|nr:acyltransferase [Enterobacter asburiae]MCK7228293.1 acyltransferase [Enterobacter asburiae]
MCYYSPEDLSELGFKNLGENVLISKKTSIYNAAGITIGNNVRIDDFCILSAGVGGIIIGNNIHIGVYSSIIGSGKVELHDFSNISSKVAIYSSNDDYSGDFMTNPMVSSDFTNVTHRDVVIGKHVIIGSGSVVLPGVTLGEGVAIGALSLVKSDCKAFFIYAGSPAKCIKKRSMGLLQHEFMLLRG